MNAPPDQVSADDLNEQGLALLNAGRYAEAVTLYNKLITAWPTYAKAFNNRGRAMRGLNLFDKAIANFDRALAADPDYAIARLNRSESLCQVGRFPEALAECDRAIAILPDLAEAHCFRGNALRALQRLDEALASYDAAIALKPLADVFNNRGAVLQDLLRLDEALQSIDEALRLNPEYAEAHVNKSQIHLLRGAFTEAWKDYEWRWRVPRHSRTAVAPSSAPRWTGRLSLQGKRVLVQAEQGLGDTIHFCRYAPLLAAKGAEVILQVQAPALDLLRFLTTHGVHAVIGPDDAVPAVDFHCPLLSLPMVFGTTLADIPANLPPPVDETHRATWRQRLADMKAPRVGISWSGSTANQSDYKRSMSLNEMLSTVPAHAAVFVLQYPVRDIDAAVLASDPRIHNFGDELKGFASTAALASLMDAVVSVDTSIAHLAANLEVPTYIALSYAPDWRWMLDRADTPWYPAARLFRQQRPGDWNHVTSRIHQALLASLKR